MIVAFAYADMKNTLAPIYRACADGLVENIRVVMPGIRILHIADDTTVPIKGCDVLRVKRKVGLMSWRLLAQCMAHGGADEILFTEPDVRFNEDVHKVFDSPFDVTMTGREFATSLKGEPIAGKYTLGANFSRSGDFWKDVTKYCLTLDAEKQTWGGDMMAVEHIADSGKYGIKHLDPAVYNHVPNQQDDLSQAKIVHYKGTRKTWLFPLVAEAA